MCSAFPARFPKLSHLGRLPVSHLRSPPPSVWRCEPSLCSRVHGAREERRGEEESQVKLPQPSSNRRFIYLVRVIKKGRLKAPSGEGERGEERALPQGCPVWGLVFSRKYIFFFFISITSKPYQKGLAKQKDYEQKKNS